MNKKVLLAPRNLQLKITNIWIRRNIWMYTDSAHQQNKTNFGQKRKIISLRHKKGILPSPLFLQITQNRYLFLDQLLKRFWHRLTRKTNSLQKLKKKQKYCNKTAITVLVKKKNADIKKRQRKNFLKKLFTKPKKNNIFIQILWNKTKLLQNKIVVLYKYC